MEVMLLFGRCRRAMLIAFFCATKIKGAQATLSRIYVDPAAASAFPSSQRSAGCGIISIRGLGRLDGDYALLHDGLRTTQERPAWIGTSAYTQNLVLSFQEGAWTIGPLSSSRAFLLFDSGTPPSRSSRWEVYNEHLSTFERADNIVSISCPACTALALSALPDPLAACNGPYHLQATNNEYGIFAWLHVSNEQCTVLHDKAGQSFLAMENQVDAAGGVPASAAEEGTFLSKEWWTKMVRQADALASVASNAGVLCTSSSDTTRLIVDMAERRQASPSKEVEVSGSDAGPPVSGNATFDLMSTQNGSIISSSHSFIHFHVLRAAEPSRSETTTAGGTAYHLADSQADDSALIRALRIEISLDGVRSTTTSLQRATTEGILLSLDGREGTHVFEISLLEEESDTCKARTVLIVEMFSAETHLVRRRPPHSLVLSPSITGGGMLAGESDFDVIRVAFMIDLEVVDGYKLSTLHLMKHLPERFQASALDLSCSSGDLPVKHLFAQEVSDVFRICSTMPVEELNFASRQPGALAAATYSVVSTATTWEDVITARPDIARALSDLYQYLATFDVLVMSNGGKDTDAYVLHVARLAGVSTRMVNLGAITGGYMSARFTGATTLIAPSHYVALNPTVVKKAGVLSVKVCHPVMDAARILSSAQACHTSGKAVPAAGEHSSKDGRGSYGGSEEGVRAVDDVGDVGLPPARFVMVGQLAAYKTPGIFVRAMAVLQRRGIGEGDRGMRRTEGVLIGKGPLLEYMKGLGRDLNANVRFTGLLSVDKVPCEVQLGTALVLPSISQETFGMVGPEAMLLGVPVITFGFGGTGELVRHMENGILVAEPTPRALADALELLARDTALRDRLGAQARLDALQALSLPEMVACHADEMLPSGKPSHSDA